MEKIKSILMKIGSYLPTTVRVIHTAVLLYLELS